MSLDVAAFLRPRDFDAAVDCNGETHWVQVRGGAARTTAHGPEEEALRALGGTPPPCMAAVKATSDARQQLINADGYLLAKTHRGAVVTDDFTLFMSTVVYHSKERAIDVLAIPQALRRFANFESLRRSKTAQQRRLLSASILHAARLIGFTDEVKFETGEEPSIRTDRRGEHRAIVVVPFDWLARVYVIGLESVESLLTLVAEPVGENLTLTQFQPDGFSLVRRVVRAADVLDGVRLPAVAHV